MTMKGMTIRASLAVVLIATSIRWSGAAAYKPNCAGHASGGNNYNDYNNNNQDNGEDEAFDIPIDYYPDPGYVEQWYPNNGVPMPKACTEPASNPRGYYTANLAPCRFQFHKITDDGDDSPYELSTSCSDENLVGVSAGKAGGSAMLEYVSQWPDECVGSFKRCYTVSKDERIFIKEACRHSLVFPEGTTHVSLDCTDDHNMKQEAIDKQNRSDGGAATDPYLLAQQKHTNDEIHEVETVLFIILGVVLVSCLGCLCAAYQLVVKPYQETMKETRRAERDGLMMSNLDDNGGKASNGLAEARVV